MTALVCCRGGTGDVRTNRDEHVRLELGRYLVCGFCDNLMNLTDSLRNRDSCDREHARHYRSRRCAEASFEKSRSESPEPSLREDDIRLPPARGFSWASPHIPMHGHLESEEQPLGQQQLGLDTLNNDYWALLVGLLDTASVHIVSQSLCKARRYDPRLDRCADRSRLQSCNPSLSQ